MRNAFSSVVLNKLYRNSILLSCDLLTYSMHILFYYISFEIERCITPKPSNKSFKKSLFGKRRQLKIYMCITHFRTPHKYTKYKKKIKSWKKICISRKNMENVQKIAKDLLKKIKIHKIKKFDNIFFY